MFDLSRYILPTDVNTDINRYLAKIRKDDGTYKAVNLTPIRYKGGKSRAVGILLSYIPKLAEKKMVSIFFGGGGFEFVLSKKLNFKIIGYDIFNFLCDYWYYQINYPKELFLELVKLKPDPDSYEINRNILLNYWEKVAPPSFTYDTKKRLDLTDEQKTMLDDDPIKRAAYYYYNHQLSYGGEFLGWASSVYTNDAVYRKICRKVRRFKAGDVTVICDSFENAIKKHPNDFLFLDPPYYLGEDSTVFKGLYPNGSFPIFHNNFDHKLLADLLREHKGGFMLTYNRCDKIEEWYDGYTKYYPTWFYSLGQGETRIGKYREENTEGSNKKDSSEIVIVSAPK